MHLMFSWSRHYNKGASVNMANFEQICLAFICFLVCFQFAPQNIEPIFYKRSTEEFQRTRYKLALVVQVAILVFECMVCA